VQCRAVREVTFLGLFEDLDVRVYLDPGVVAIRNPADERVVSGEVQILDFIGAPAM
jgi:hypothetical protein